MATPTAAAMTAAVELASRAVVKTAVRDILIEDLEILYAARAALRAAREAGDDPVYVGILAGNYLAYRRAFLHDWGKALLKEFDAS